MQNTICLTLKYPNQQVLLKNSYMRYLLICLLLFVSINLSAQISTEDKNLLMNLNSSKNLKFKDRDVKLGFGKNNYWVDYSFGSLMYFYQKYLSVQVSASCLYSPTCSSYSKLLFKKYGFFKGLFTSADRILRCDRISATDLRVLEIDKHDHKVHENVNYYNFKED